MNEKGDFVAGVIVGTLIGGVVAVLFAPASGKETRGQITEKSKEVKGVAEEKAREKSEAVASASKELLSKLKEKLPKNQETQDALNEVEKEVK